MFFRNHVRRSFTSFKKEVEHFEDLSIKFIQCIEKYKREKEICPSTYTNYKREIKECLNVIFNKNHWNNLEKNDFKLIFTYSILLSKRMLFQKEPVKDAVLAYILYRKNNDNDVQGEEKDEINEWLLILKFLFYLNVEYDKTIYNHVYSELSNIIEESTLEELVESVKLISSFKNKKWVNFKVFSRCINEIVKRCTSGRDERNGEDDISKFLISIIKSCSRLNCEITDIHDLLESFRICYDKNKKKNMHVLIKIIYNLFICNYHNYKNTNQLIHLLKHEIMQKEKEEEYPVYKKYLYNENVVLDNNLDANTDMTKNNVDAHISYDNINNIHNLYLRRAEKEKDAILNTPVESINLYRLKFIDLFIRSDNYLYNRFYLPNSHLFDFVKQLKVVTGRDLRDTIFSKQAKFFIKENGFRMAHTYVHIYPVVHLPDFPNTYVEFVHRVFVNREMKDSLNKFHKNQLNHKIRHMKFLGWEPILLYEHEWKKLRNYNDKFEYIKKTFKSMRNHTQ
ncbi:conserved Plasmodium protein, unknown function [Plasmodium ovale]|uniref:RAP domain-containing protein n=1 Tax=Plasmodium ovale TaxID=36330 RepID=A0A1C3KVL9_PLAOA|nr:conserved Plasmodium protein, unknown function [Plasmodium ovale]